MTQWKRARSRMVLTGTRPWLPLLERLSRQRRHQPIMFRIRDVMLTPRGWLIFRRFNTD